MTIESNTTDTTKAPKWLQEVYPHKEEYWTCTGKDIKQKTGWLSRFKKPIKDQRWRAVFYTQEEAEAYSFERTKTWIWD